MKLIQYVCAIAISWAFVSTLDFTSTRDQLQECRAEKATALIDTVKIPVISVPLVDSIFVDTVIVHWGSHPGSITWDTMIVRCEIKIDTIKKFYQKTWK